MRWNTSSLSKRNAYHDDYQSLQIVFFIIHGLSFLSSPDLRKQIRIAQAGQSNVTAQDLKWL